MYSLGRYFASIQPGIDASGVPCDDIPGSTTKISGAVRLALLLDAGESHAHTTLEDC